MNVHFHASKKSYWLNAYNSMPYCLTYVITACALLVLEPCACYNKYADEVHLNLPVIKDLYDRDVNPTEVQPDTLVGRVHVNLEHEAVHRALEDIDEEFSLFFNSEEKLVEEVLKKSNPELVEERKTTSEVVVDVFSGIF
jgi:hypothetical protein